MIKESKARPRFSLASRIWDHEAELPGCDFAISSVAMGGEGDFSSKIEVGDVTVEFDLSGAIDVKAERARLTKDLAQAERRSCDCKS
jgi:hypothetical protein